MRERLIKLLNNQCCPSPLLCDANCKYAHLESCYPERVVDYLIENGVVVPPCKVGQKVWKLMFWLKSPAEIIEGKVSMLQQKADGTWKIRITRRSSVEDITLDEIGKTVFLSREEAEMVLKGGSL